MDTLFARLLAHAQMLSPERHVDDRAGADYFRFKEPDDYDEDYAAIAIIIGAAQAVLYRLRR